MSTDQPGQNGPETSLKSPSTYKDAKAEARAAKAYAKAQRPWFKKKRIIIPSALVTLVVVASAASGGGDSGPGTVSASAGAASTSNDEKPAKDREQRKAKAPGKVGQSLTNAGTTYTVTNVRTTDTLGDPDFLGERADGTFVVVSLKLRNNKDETKTFMEANAKLETSDGKRYETSDKAVLAFGEEGLMLKDIQPDLTTRGKLALRPSPAQGQRLDAHRRGSLGRRRGQGRPRPLAGRGEGAYRARPLT